MTARRVHLNPGQTDVVESADMVHASIDGPLLERLGGLLSYLKLGNPKLIKKLRRKEREQEMLLQQQAAAAVGGGMRGGPAAALAPAVTKPADADEARCHPSKFTAARGRLWRRPDPPSAPACPSVSARTSSATPGRTTSPPRRRKRPPPRRRNSALPR